MYAPHAQKFSKSNLNKDIQIVLSTIVHHKDTLTKENIQLTPINEKVNTEV